VGSIGTNADILSNQLVANLATSLNARYRLLHTPAFIREQQERKLIMDDPVTRDNIALAENVDIAVLAFGSTEQTVKYGGDYINGPEMDELIEKGWVGDIALHIIDKDGRLMDHPIHERLIAADLSKTRKNARNNDRVRPGATQKSHIESGAKGPVVRHTDNRPRYGCRCNGIKQPRTMICITDPIKAARTMS
jgi:hypothetical protein